MANVRNKFILVRGFAMVGASNDVNWFPPVNFFQSSDGLILFTMYDEETRIFFDFLKNFTDPITNITENKLIYTQQTDEQEYSVSLLFGMIHIIPTKFTWNDIKNASIIIDLAQAFDLLEAIKNL